MDKIEQIARMCHQVNKAWCRVKWRQYSKDWDQAQQWQRQRYKRRGFKLDNPQATTHSTMLGWLIK
jgi:hypothetical protein